MFIINKITDKAFDFANWFLHATGAVTIFSTGLVLFLLFMYKPTRIFVIAGLIVFIIV